MARRGDFPLDLLDQIPWRVGELEGKNKEKEKKREEKKR